MKRILLKLIKGFGIFLLLMVIIYALGPIVRFDKVNGKIAAIDVPLEGLADYVAIHEAQVANLKEGNEAHIVWADSVRKTPYCIVYLHGFSASPKEGDPIHRQIAARYGCNLYLARIAGHGIDDKDIFATLTPQSMIESAKEAIAIGKALGEKVILMSCSTGGTFSIYLSAMNPDDIAAQILYSPNIELVNPLTALLTMPWGLEIATEIEGEYRKQEFPQDSPIPAYNTTNYRIEGVIALQALLEETMTEEVFKQVKQPYFLGYYYKNEEEQDPVVSVEAMLNFDQHTQTTPAQKQVVAFPDVKTHVIPSGLHSEDLEAVYEATCRFMEEVLGLMVKG